VTRGSLVALAGGGAAAVIVVVAGVALLVRGCGGSGAPAATTASGLDPATRAGAEGMGAPGTAELRGAGCASAVVVDMQRLLGSGGQVREGEPRYMVTCDVPQSAGAPACEKLAATYFRAIGGKADANVNVRVEVSGSDRPACSRLYAPGGIDLGPFPRLP
jgi:hypothetical protein